jgi:hypothetical protein
VGSQRLTAWAMARPRHGIYISSFMKIGTGVQAIVMFCLRNMRGCNVGINYEWDLWITHLKLWHCLDVHTKFHKDWLRHSKVNGELQTHTHTEAGNWSHKPTSIFLNKESRLKIKTYKIFYFILNTLERQVKIIFNGLDVSFIGKFSGLSAWKEILVEPLFLGQNVLFRALLRHLQYIFQQSPHICHVYIHRSIIYIYIYSSIWKKTHSIMEPVLAK